MKVAVVGAGFAGLRAALLLEGKGHDVMVFEGRDRLGGRAHTVETAQGWFEAGGEWIDSDHVRVLALLQELGLEAEPSDQWPGRVVFESQECEESEIWPEAKVDSDRVESKAQQLCQDLGHPAWETPGAAKLDAETLHGFLDEHCVSKPGRWLLEAQNRSNEGEDPREIGLLGWLVGYRNYLARAGGEMGAFRFKTGAQNVCVAMASRLRGQVFTDHLLRSLENCEDHVELWFKEEAVFVDKAVLAMPPKPLLQVDFGAGLPESLDSALQGLGAARAIKVVLQFDRAWWLDQGWKGRMLADKRFQQCWSGGRAGLPAISCYVGGEEAIKLTGLRDPVSACLDDLALVEPVAKEHFVGGSIHDWVHDPFSQCAFTSLPPGSVTKSLPYLCKSWNNVHFAGEWCSDWMGYYEGALESAERVAQEIG